MLIMLRSWFSSGQEVTLYFLYFYSFNVLEQNDTEEQIGR